MAKRQRNERTPAELRTGAAVVDGHGHGGEDR